MKIPERMLKQFAESVRGLEYGTAMLEIHIKGGTPRAVITRQDSLLFTKEELEEFLREDRLESRDD